MTKSIVLSCRLAHDPTFLIHKTVDGAPLCDTDPISLTPINTTPGHPDRAKLRHGRCNDCAAAYDAARHAEIVAAGGRSATCDHGYGPLDSCPICD